MACVPCRRLACRPPAADDAVQADAIVVALKSRTIPAADAVAQSLAALAWLRAQGCRQFVFKYCSTFDSTDAGNIGPVAEALLEALGSGLHHRLPGLPRERPHHLPRPPVRGRYAAERIRHGAPPAHADDRRQPGSRAATPEPGQGRPAALRQRGTRCRRGPCAHRRPACRRRAAGDCRCDFRRRPVHARPGLRGPATDYRRLGHRARPARELPPRRPAAATRGCRRGAVRRWSRRGAGWQRIARHQCAGGPLDRPEASRAAHRPAAAGPWRAGGGRSAGLPPITPNPC